MTRYKATISYDGTLFAGFQRQPHARSVQEEIEKTLTRLNQGTPVTVHGAGRTDSGVHALGQVIHFDLPQARDEEKLRFALDTQTPEDIDFIRVEQAPEAIPNAMARGRATIPTMIPAMRSDMNVFLL